MPSPRVALGVRVRELREARTLSQEAFAHKAGLDRTYVSGIERGRRNPTLDVLYRLADALEVEVRDLFPGKP
ncbi:helix-turn-helix domain-containing protein [Microbacterium keratanolyticum]